ncbi:MAG: cation:proton antiporter [Deltaproteobacteria bacterium]|nr:cation:proton antiporter [Deltaproteobacteria bacterium]
MGLQHIKMQILEMGLLILAAYSGGKLAQKLKIGEVVGQILGGVIVGPHFLELIHKILVHYDWLQRYVVFRPIYHFYDTQFPEYARVLEGYHFFVFLFLGIIAFSIGEELHRDRLRQVGIAATMICVLQALLTFLLGFLGFWLIFRFSVINALLMGAIGIATAPALTFVLMNKLKVEGQLKSILANIVVLDDIIEVVFFSVILGIALALQRGGSISSTHLAIEVIKELLFAAGIGALIFLLLKVFIRKKMPTEDEVAAEPNFLSMVMSEHPTPSLEILVVITGIVAVGLAVAIEFNLPFLITAVVAGFLVSNFHSHALFDSLKIENVMPLFNLMFFAIIGSSVRVESLSSGVLVYVIGYLVFRTVGKLVGNWAGCRLTAQDPKITACLPKLMLPQAGMAAVETILVATVLKQSGGMKLFNTIIPALVVFELVGAWLSEKTLLKWKSWTVGEREALDAPHVAGSGFSLHELIGQRICRLMAQTRDDAIFELGTFCVSQRIIPEVGILTNPVREREKLASTAIGDGIALPHFRTGLLKRTVVVCGLLQHPVDWNAPDHQPVDLVFLLISPEQYPEEHLEAIRAIGLALRKPDFRDGLTQAVADGTTAAYLKSFTEAKKDAPTADFTGQTAQT